MKSTNFEFLSPRWSELAELGAFAEAYTFNDPTSAIIKLRLFAENMTKDIYRDLKLPRPEQLSFIDYLTNDTFKTITPKVVLNKFHSLRINGNKAAHGELSKPDKALFLLQEAFDLARWLYVQFEKGDPQSIQAFQKPQLIEQGDSKAELKKQKKQALEKLAIQEARMESLLQELEEVRQKAETAQQNSEELQALFTDFATKC